MKMDDDLSILDLLQRESPVPKQENNAEIHDSLEQDLLNSPGDPEKQSPVQDWGVNKNADFDFSGGGLEVLT